MSATIPSVTPDAITRARRSWLVFVGIGLVYFAFLRTGIFVVDGRSMFMVAWSLAHKATFAIPCTWGRSQIGVPGRGGVCYSQWYPLLSILAAPVVAVSSRLAAPLNLPQLNLAAASALIVPALSGAAAAAVTMLLACRLGAPARGAVLAAIGMAFGTEMFTYARTFFAEVPAAMFVGIGAWGLFAGGRARWAGYCALALAVLTKPQMVVVGPALGLGLALGERDALRLVAPSVASAVGGVLYLGYNLLRFGDLFHFGPSAHFSLTHLPIGIAFLLISPGRGLLWYSPLAALGAVVLWRMRGNPLAVACLAASVAILVEYASKVPLGGGLGWGTRLLVPAFPLLCAPLGTLSGGWAKVAVALAVVGLIVESPTSISYFERYYSEMVSRGVPREQVIWSVAHCPLIGVWPSAAHTISDAAKSDPRTLIKKSGRRSRSVDTAQLLHGLAVWWWFLPALGIPLWAGVLLALAACLGGALILWRAATAPGPPDETGWAADP